MKIRTVWTVVALLRPDGTLCFKYMRRGPFKGVYNFPGGKRRAKESPFITTRREVSEEMGIDVPLHRIEDVGVIYNINPQGEVVGRCHVHLVRVAQAAQLSGAESRGAKWAHVSEMMRCLTHPHDHLWMRAVLDRRFVVVYRYSRYRMSVRVLRRRLFFSYRTMRARYGA